MKRILAAAILGIVLSACSINTTAPTITPTSTQIFQTPTPAPTITFFTPLAHIPADKFLFVEILGGIECSEMCNCESEPVPTPYYFQDGKLVIRDFFIEYQSDWNKARNGATGFYAYYSFWIESHNLFFTTFPFKTPDSDFAVQRLNSRGEISVKTNYGEVLVEVDKSMESNWVEYTSQPDCQLLHFTKLINHGLINDSDVIIEVFEP